MAVMRFLSFFLIPLQMLFSSSSHPLFAQNGPQPDIWQIQGFLNALDDQHEGTALYAWNHTDAPAILAAQGPLRQPVLDAARRHARSLVLQLEHGNSDRRRRAASALAVLGSHAAPEISRIAELLTDDDPRRRQAGTRVLGELGDFAQNYVPFIAELLEDADPRVQTTALEALRELSGIAELSRMLGQWQNEAANAFEDGITAATILLSLSVPVDRVLIQDQRAVVERFWDRNPDLLMDSRLNSSWQLAQRTIELFVRIESPSRSPVPSAVYLRTLDDPQASIRANSVRLLAGQPDAREYLPELAASLTDRDERVQLAGVEALGQLGELAESERPGLTGLLTTAQSPSILAAAMAALRRIGDPTIEDAGLFSTFLNHADPRVRLNATNALGPFPAYVSQYIQSFLIILDDEDPRVRAAAADAIGGLDNEGRVHAGRLARLLSDEVESVQAAAAQALVALGPFSVELMPSILHPLYGSAQK